MLETLSCCAFDGGNPSIALQSTCFAAEKLVVFFVVLLTSFPPSFLQALIIASIPLAARPSSTTQPWTIGIDRPSS